jgi:ABC-type transport system involved in Fe-S cluster assembly fused permease/ATPase subunit
MHDEGQKMQNGKYGKEGATLEEVKQAVELANAANFIDKLPDVSN